MMSKHYMEAPDTHTKSEGRFFGTCTSPAPSATTKQTECYTFIRQQD
uniref:Uncharacterized protein n=1 Tax=Arundo donax TaxID=35708 RepID=A0A0A8ZS09_ARUDO